VLIRLAGPEDLPAVGEVTVAAYTDFTLGPDDPYVARLRDAAARHEQAELWVAEEDGVVLGTVTVCPPGSVWREISGPDEGEFRMLAVAPAARGRGVGEALARHAVARFAEDGVHALVLSSLAAMHAAHRIYERLGFERAPGRDWSPMPGVELLAYELRGEPRAEASPVHDHPGDLARADQLAGVGGRDREPHQPAVGVRDGRGHLELPADDARGEVLEADPGADAGLVLGELVGEGGAGRRLAPREQPRGREHLQVARAEGARGVVIGDREREHGGGSGGDRHPPSVPVRGPVRRPPPERGFRRGRRT
jgi:GNAT superfamily N-acetyltransferase